MLTTHQQQIPQPAPRLFASRGLLFDEDRFLVDPGQWNGELADRIARSEGIAALGEQHWRVIRHVRERFESVGGLPGMRRVCRATGLSREEIHGLFGGCLPLWRIAGLPNPGEEARSYV